MEIKSRFDHFNINVLDLDRSIAFLMEKALGLKRTSPQGSDRRFVHLGLSDRQRDRISVGTDLASRPERSIRIGRQMKSHLCFRVAGDYDKVREYHRELGYICFEN